MAKAKDIHSPETVAAYIQKLDPAVGALTDTIRKVILSTDPIIGEQIKWNAPSFFYNDQMEAFDAKEYKRDMIVLNFNKKEYVLLVFPTGAKVADDTGLLEGNYPDGRRMFKITGEADLEVKIPALQKVIRQWLALIGQ